MALLQLCGYVFNAQPLLSEHHQQVVQQVAGLVDQMLLTAVGSLNDRLQGLFSYLLGYLVDTFIKQTGGIGPLGHLLFATVYERLQLTQEE